MNEYASIYAAWWNLTMFPIYLFWWTDQQSWTVQSVHTYWYDQALPWNLACHFSWSKFHRWDWNNWKYWAESLREIIFATSNWTCYLYLLPIHFLLNLYSEGHSLNPVQLDGVQGGNVKTLGNKLNKHTETHGFYQPIGTLYGFILSVQTERSEKEGVNIKENRFS